MNLKNRWQFVIIFILSVISCRQLLKPGMPYTHDGENHLARFANYKHALKEGQLPPRFAPNLLNHYGYPVFNYNYPLANMLSLPFSAFHLSYETTFALIALSFVFFGGVGVKKWLDSWFAVGLYFASYYLANLILFRGNIGEIMAFSLMPWLLLSARWLSKDFLSSKKYFWLVLLWTAMICAHNISFLMAVMGFLLWALINWPTKMLLIIKRQLAIGLIATLLASWFWLPALLEIKYVAAAGSEINSATALHLLAIGQLFRPSLGFGYSEIGSADTLSFGLGVIQILVLLLAVAEILTGAPGKVVHKLWLAFVLLLILLPTTAFSIVWQTPLFNLWQFPWRWQWLSSLLLLPIAAWTWQKTGKRLKSCLLIVLGLQLIYLWQLSPIDRFHKANFEYDNFSQTTTSKNENLPQTFKYIPFADWQAQPLVYSGKAEIEVQSWTGTSRTYHIQVFEPTIIIEPTAYFPGWQSKTNGQLLTYLDNDQIAGRIAYQLAVGDYQITTRFYQLTWPRRLGNSLSLISAIGLTIYYLRTRTNAKIK